MNSSGRAVGQQRETTVCSPSRRGNGAPGGYHLGPECSRRTVIQRKLVRLSGLLPIGVNGRENDDDADQQRGRVAGLFRTWRKEARPCGLQVSSLARTVRGFVTEPFFLSLQSWKLLRWRRSERFAEERRWSICTRRRNGVRAGVAAVADTWPNRSRLRAEMREYLSQFNGSPL